MGLGPAAWQAVAGMTAAESGLFAANALLVAGLFAFRRWLLTHPATDELPPHFADLLRSTHGGPRFAFAYGLLAGHAVPLGTFQDWVNFQLLWRRVARWHGGRAGWDDRTGEPYIALSDWLPADRKPGPPTAAEWPRWRTMQAAAAHELLHAARHRADIPTARLDREFARGRADRFACMIKEEAVVWFGGFVADPTGTYLLAVRRFWWLPAAVLYADWLASGFRPLTAAPLAAGGLGYLAVLATEARGGRRLR